MRSPEAAPPSLQDSLEPRPTPLSEELRQRFGPYVASPDVRGGFRNPWPHPPIPTVKDALRWKMEGKSARPRGYRPAPEALPPDPFGAFESLPTHGTRLLWIGHASFYVELDGVRVVIDPIFGRAGGVVPRVTPAAVTPDALPPVHAVLVTHGHHDHFDPKSLTALARAQGASPLFVVPRGLRAALPRACERVVELDWWQFVGLGSVRIHLVPAQHWHRRGLFDHNKALWGGFVLEGTHRIYHSGDTGYFDGFGAIGAVFDGIDVACLPLGAYEPTWFMGPQHMAPADSLRAWRELGATHFVGMHWGAFDLSDEPVDAGPRWLLEAARASALPRERIHVLAPGGSLALGGPLGATSAEVNFPWNGAGAL